jgi:hypothetical protein
MNWYQSGAGSRRFARVDFAASIERSRRTNASRPDIGDLLEVEPEAQAVEGFEPEVAVAGVGVGAGH